MNLFQAIYCNQYEELLRTGRDTHKARKNGIVIITVAVVINLFTLLYTAMLLGRGGPFAPWLHQLTGALGSGRRAGQVVALILIGVVGVLVYFTFGRAAYYHKTIAQFHTLPPARQKRIARLGAAYLLGSVGLLILLIFGGLLHG